MAKYRPIFTKIWKDPDFMDLDAVDKLIFIYLCTNDLTTDSGIYSISCKTIAGEIDIPSETVIERLRNGSIKNIVYDESNKYVFVVKFKKYNAGGKPKLVEKGIVNDFKISKHTYLWSLFIEEYPIYKDAIVTVSQPLPNPDTTVCQPLSNPDTTVSQPLSNPDTTVCQPLPVPDKSSRTIPIPKPKPKPKIALFTNVNKAPENQGHFSDQVGNYAEPIIKHCREILKLPQKKGRQIFNPFQWVQFQTNKKMHPGAILETVEALANPNNWNGIRDGPWAYATTIIKTKNGNWNERDHIAEAETFKQTWISPEIQKLIKDIGS